MKDVDARIVKPNHDIESEELWPMGAVTRRTGITEHTLRAWERRFGFPDPVRLPSGHRRYTGGQVRRLLLVNQALAKGYRAGDVVSLAPERLESLLLGRAQTAEAEVSDEAMSTVWVDEILSEALRFDEQGVRSRIDADAATLGLGPFLRKCAVPLVAALGDAWVRGDIAVRHEHFVTAILEDRLASFRTALAGSAAGRPVVLACLPGEMHGLGLQLVAAEIAAAGRRTLVLGPHTPISEIVATGESLDAAAVGISVSAFAPSESTREHIVQVRSELPGQVFLWVGGAGVGSIGELPGGVTHVDTLDDLSAALSTLA